MVTHANNVRAQAALLLGNAMAVPNSVWSMLTLEQKKQAIDVYISKIEELMTDELSLAKVRDDSDVVVHAEGPALNARNWNFRAFNSVVDSLNAVLRTVVADNLFKFSSNAITSKIIRQQVNIQVTGFAPGSLVVGAKVSIPEETGFFKFEDIEQVIHGAVNSVPRAGAFVTSEGISGDISDALDDPAIRDSAIVAASILSPSGRVGVDEITVSATDGDKLLKAVLTPEKRHILRKAIRTGAIGKNSGNVKIKGIVREVNLDTKRFSLRSDEGCLVRCFLGGLGQTLAKQMLDKEVIVQGIAQKDKSGRVRLVSLSENPILTKAV